MKDETLAGQARATRKRETTAEPTATTSEVNKLRREAHAHFGQWLETGADYLRKGEDFECGFHSLEIVPGFWTDEGGVIGDEL